jgi:hypothetical protein
LKIVVLDQKVVDLNLVEMVEVRQQSVIWYLGSVEQMGKRMKEEVLDVQWM